MFLLNSVISLWGTSNKDIMLPKKIINLKRPLEFFKTYDLHETYGEEYVKYKSFDASEAEDICMDMFYSMVKTDGSTANRGDFVCNGKYFDQKTAQVCHKLPTGKPGKYFKVKYSNVNAKMFVQIVFKELDLIIEDIKDSGRWNKNRHARLTYIRYKTEMTFDDMWFIDEEIIKGEKVKSFCGRNNHTFLWFINDLCSHNVRRFSHLIIFHSPMYESQNHVLEQIDEERYTTYKKHGNYLVTPINMNLTNIYVDYIGFGGFKIYVPFNQVDKKNIVTPNKIMKEHLNELNEAINISLAVSCFKSVWSRTPWKPSHEWMPTDNWVENYVDVDKNIEEEYWEYQKDV